ncbi:hypothetical protein [Achromobacter mucicolens]|uniref:hypothetical protein n=1 Tax=Achromobacter mucicolens TaxID=1389922 RepID=UPI0015831B69|nr:hypothetical protein [Achromobacter mucicolens]
MKKAFGDDVDDALQRYCVADHTPAVRKAAVEYIYSHKLVQVARLRFAFHGDPAAYPFHEHDFRRARASLSMNRSQPSRFDEPSHVGESTFEGYYDAARHYGKPVTARMLMDWMRYAQDTFLTFCERIGVRDYQIRYRNRESRDGRPAHTGPYPGEMALKRPDELIHLVRAYAPASLDLNDLVREFSKATSAVSVDAEMVILGPDGKDLIAAQHGNVAALFGNR